MPVFLQLLVALLLVWAVVFVVVWGVSAKNAKGVRRARFFANFATIVLLVVGLYLWPTNFYNDHWATCHVTGKTPEADGGGVVTTSDCGPLTVRDMWNRESDLGETWKAIVVGKSYDFRLAGIQVDFVVSWYPNIIDMKPAGS